MTQRKMKYCQLLEKEIPGGSFELVIDAGMLGSYENAVYLANQGRKFIISCRSDCPSPLWQYFQPKLKLHDWKYIASPQMIALSYYAKKSKGQKKL